MKERIDEKEFEKNTKSLKYKNVYNSYELAKKEMRKEKGYTTNDGVDYYHHLIDIAQQLINIGIKDEDLITASILQELVENCLLEDGTNKYSKETIEVMFNERIANIIEGVTNNSKNEYKENKDLFVEYLEKIKKY